VGGASAVLEEANGGIDQAFMPVLLQMAQHGAQCGNGIGPTRVGHEAECHLGQPVAQLVLPDRRAQRCKPGGKAGNGCRNVRVQVRGCLEQLVLLRLGQVAQVRAQRGDR
jgi:hypothetical protein